MKRILLIVLAALPLCVMAQGLNKPNRATKLVVKPKKKTVVTGGTTQTKEEVVVEDTAYYRDMVRKNQWYEGRGDSLTREQALHLPCYFRMTIKNGAGHWQHVEAMCGDTLTANHDISHYVLDKRFDSSSASNKQWVERLSTVAQWFLTTGIDEDVVVEERAYDSEGNMVYGYLPTRNANGRITGCYNDQWGLPVDMSEDSLYTYGSVVYIALDRCGRDSIIDFLDGQGLPKLNPNGVDQQRYRYDDKDRIIESTSHNIVGDRVIDNWGNCGNTFDYINDSCYVVTTIDTEGKPMRMPEGRASATRTYYKCRVTLDKWGRIVRREMLDADDNPSATLAGISRIEYTYSESPDGRWLSTTETWYDNDGHEMVRQ